MLPDSIPESLWIEFRKMRVRIKHPMTEYAETLILKKLERWRLDCHADVIAILEESIERSWAGVFLNGHGKLPVTTKTDQMSPKEVCASCGRSLEAGFKYSSKGRLCHECF
jgi:hypothetical protein